MLTFGLTGGIASGKSSVARLFREWGIPVVDADRIARQVVERGSPVLQAIVDEFGSAVLLADGSLNRPALGAIVFAQAERLARLNELVHPAISDEAKRELEALAATGESIACYDVPLLFETGQQETYRPVIVVDAPLETRVHRIIARDGLDRPSAMRRIEAQIPLLDKVKAADFVIDNSLDLKHLREQARSAIEQVRARAGSLG